MNNDPTFPDRQPLVSVIVPVYNIAEHLDECLEHLVNQTYANIEVLLIDDGSTDQSGNICDAWASRDPRVMVIHQANSGPSAARNRGLDKAAGAYIAFVDGDDVCADTYLETLLRPLLNTNVDISLCSYDRISVDGDLYDPRAIPEIDKGSIELFATLVLHDDLFPAPWAKVLAAKCAKSIRFDEDAFIGEDVRAWSHLMTELESLSFCTVNETLYHYRDNDSSIVRSYHAERERDIIKAWDMFCEASSSRFGEAVEPVVRFRRAWMWFEVLDRAIYYGEVDNHDYCEEAISYLREHADDVYASDVFTHNRKQGMRVLSISKPLYVVLRRATKKRA